VRDKQAGAEAEPLTSRQETRRDERTDESVLAMAEADMSLNKGELSSHLAATTENYVTLGRSQTETAKFFANCRITSTPVGGLR
jgi:hypothetical protein